MGAPSVRTFQRSKGRLVTSMNKKPIRVGTRAPRFQLPFVSGDGLEQDTVELDDFLDQWLVLIFYPRDFSLI